MGEAPLAQKEHLLILMPYDEPTDVIEDIRKTFPHIEVTFYRPQNGPGGDRSLAGSLVPKGWIFLFLFPRSRGSCCTKLI